MTVVLQSPGLLPTLFFRRRIAVGFAAVAILSLVISLVSFHALRSVIQSKDLVISDYAHNLLSVRELEVYSEQEVASSRAFLLTRDPDFQARTLHSRTAFIDGMKVLRNRFNPNENRLLDRIMETERSHWQAMALAILQAEGNDDPRKLSKFFEDAVQPKREALRSAFLDLIALQELQLQGAMGDSKRSADRMSLLVAVIGVLAAAVAGGLFFLSHRTLRQLERAERGVRELNLVLEKRVAERTTELTSTVKELEGFAHTVAHDLRTPLRALAGFSKLLTEDFARELRPPGPEYLARIESAARHMDELIVDLLDYSRLSYSKLELHPVDLHAAVTGILRTMDGDIRKCRGRVEIEGRLGLVLASETLLVAMIQNLITNALKFVSPGTDPVVRVSAEAKGGRVRLCVADNGIGIPPAYHERIFEIFQRLHRSEELPGTGIGLAIVRKAAARMGVRVGVESEPGKGSCFWVEFMPAPEEEPRQGEVAGTATGRFG